MESNITIDIDNDSFGISSEDTIDDSRDKTIDSSLKNSRKVFGSSNSSLSEIKKHNSKREVESEKVFYSGKKKQKSDKSDHLIVFGRTNKILNISSRDKADNECKSLSISGIEINSNLCNYVFIQDFKGNMYFNRSKNGALYIAKFTNVESIIDKGVFEKGIKNPYRFQNLNTETKHWNQRYYYYSKYDEGIKMDTESWYSVTPEDLAFYISKIAGKDSICIDPFAGSGGNVIQFSKNCQKVYAVDIDPIKIDLCINNSKVYKCPDNIDFITKDSLKLEGLKVSQLIKIRLILYFFHHHGEEQITNSLKIIHSRKWLHLIFMR